MPLNLLPARLRRRVEVLAPKNMRSDSLGLDTPADFPLAEWEATHAEINDDVDGRVPAPSVAEFRAGWNGPFYRLLGERLKLALRIRRLCPSAIANLPRKYSYTLPKAPPSRPLSAEFTSRNSRNCGRSRNLQSSDHEFYIGAAARPASRFVKSTRRSAGRLRVSDTTNPGEEVGFPRFRRQFYCVVGLLKL